MPFIPAIIGAVVSGLGTVGSAIAGGLGAAGSAVGGALGSAAPAIGAISSGVGLASDIAGMVGGRGGSGDGSITPAQQLPSAASNISDETKRRQQQALLARRLVPGLTSATSGSLSPDYYNQLSSQLGGVFGDNNPSSINPGGGGWLGLSGGSGSGGNNNTSASGGGGQQSEGGGFMDLLAQLQGLAA